LGLMKMTDERWEATEDDLVALVIRGIDRLLSFLAGIALAAITAGMML
jgi:hypothetical protein